MQPVAVMPLPGCADHVAGIIRWRRAVVPVIDFRAPEERSGHSDGRRLIAQCGARHGGALVAFSIDADVMLCRADAAHRQLRDVPCPSFASGIFDVNGEPVALLDLDALLDPLRLRNGDPVLPDLLIEGAARDTQAVSGPLDAPAFGV
jgi:chemotaxis signal transduction protein